MVRNSRIPPAPATPRDLDPEGAKPRRSKRPVNEEPLLDIRRADDAVFNSGVDDLVREAEQTRLSLMQARQRRGFIVLTISIVLLLAAGAGFGWYFLVEGDLLRAFACVGLAVIPPLLMSAWRNHPIKSYMRYHKKTFMPKMAKLMGGFNYQSAGGIDSRIFSKTGIVPAYNSYTSEDCFMGRYKGIKVIISEASLYRGAPVFQGLFVLLQLPGQPFEGRTIITADAKLVQENTTGRWKTLQKVVVTTENSSWNRFSIFAEKPAHTTTVVTPSLLKELAEAADVFNTSPLTVSMFGKNHVFITIPYRGDMFEASAIHEAVPTREHALERRREIEKLMEVVDIFDAYKDNLPAASN
jgi:hypothetical protein